jgi:hypothetical protein
MYFVLRNGGDSAQANPPPIGLQQLTGSSPIAAGIAPRFTKAQAQAKPAQYEVETFLGNKRVVNNFK